MSEKKAQRERGGVISVILSGGDLKRKFVKEKIQDRRVGKY